MRHGLQTAIALLYPPRCLGCGDLVESDFGLCGPCWRDTPFISGTVCESCGVPLPGEADGFRIDCDDCLSRPRPWDDGRAALIYTGRARELVLALKHADRQDIARAAGPWLARAAGPLLTPQTLVAPVPLHWVRMLKRRYNQAALLSAALSRETGQAHCPDLLQRTGRTPPLEKATVADRFAALSGAIRLHPRRRHRIAGRPVLLVDDVMTSGATLAAAAEACRAAGAARVSVVVLARAVKD